MKKLDIAHHKVIMLCFVLLVFITGILFGVKIRATGGIDALVVITFALSFLAIIMLFLIFTQLVHVNDTLARRKK